jgi:hypothetical protein
MMPLILKAFPAMVSGYKTTIRNLQKKKEEEKKEKKKRWGEIEESITRSTRKSSLVAHLTFKTQRLRSLHQDHTHEVTEFFDLAWKDKGQSQMTVTNIWLNMLH